MSLDTVFSLCSVSQGRARLVGVLGSRGIVLPQLSFGHLSIEFSLYKIN